MQPKIKIPTMFDVPPKCPALANKLTGIFGWRHTYKVSAKHEGIQHTFLQKSYSLTLPKRPPSPYRGQKVIVECVGKSAKNQRHRDIF